MDDIRFVQLNGKGLPENLLCVFLALLPGLWKK